MLQTLQTAAKNLTLESIMETCSAAQNITNDQIKRFFVVMANGLKQISEKYSTLNVQSIKEGMIEMVIEEAANSEKQFNAIKKSIIQIDIKIDALIKDKSMFDSIGSTIQSSQYKLKRQYLHKVQMKHRQSEQQKLLPSPIGSWTKPKQLVDASEWIDHHCFCNDRLILKHNKISVKDCVYIFAATPISDCPTFSIMFKKFAHYAAIGIISRQYRQQADIRNLPHSVLYSHQGQLQIGPQEQDQGTGFKVGEVITVDVNMRTGDISWLANGQTILHKHALPIIKDKKQIQWVPIVLLWTKGDEIVVIQ